MTIPEHLRAAYLATTLVTWDQDGFPVVLSGPWSDDLPGRRLHVITAWDPNGRPGGRKENAAAHRRLIADVEALGVQWSPAVGAARDGSHHELGIVTDALTPARAIALGAEHGQLAVFELDDERLHVLPCDGDAPLVGERGDLFGEQALTEAHLRRGGPSTRRSPATGCRAPGARPVEHPTPGASSTGCR